MILLFKLKILNDYLWNDYGLTSFGNVLVS